MKKEYLLMVACSILLLSCSSTKKSEPVSTSDEVYEITGHKSESANTTKEYINPERAIEAEYPASSIEMNELDRSTEILEIADAKTEIYESDSRDKSIRRGNREQARVNLLTATEVNDFKKWEEWKELLDLDFAPYKQVWKFIPRQRFVARASDKNQRPIVDAVVKLYDSKNKLVWSTRTDNTGTAQLWANILLSENNQDKGFSAPYKIVFTCGNEQKTIENAQPYPQETNVVKMNTTSRPTNDIDIFFIIDATGSMGDELNYLQSELYNIIDKVKQNQSNLNIRMGSLVYRDWGDEYVTRKSSLSPDISKTVSFLKKQYADGGGDYPEAVDEALYQSIEKENWKESALSRIAFLVLDAPPHNNSKSINRIQEQIVTAAMKGIRLIPLVASGMQQDGEYLMRCIALSTNGTYVTLTDDSGIGNPHAKPTTNYYKVEKLNDLIIRLINDYTKIPQTLR